MPEPHAVQPLPYIPDFRRAEAAEGLTVRLFIEKELPYRHATLAVARPLILRLLQEDCGGIKARPRAHDLVYPVHEYGAIHSGVTSHWPAIVLG